jgi:hypothetical protein
MPADTDRSNPDRVAAGPAPGRLEHRLERGDVIHFLACPFPLPEGDDRLFLRQQRLTGRHKAISWDPATDRTSGFPAPEAEAQRLRRLLADFAAASSAWLAGAVPRYAGQLRSDRVGLHVEEEATRRLRLTSRNDLLHVDAFPSRPTDGRRILRLFVNIDVTDPRVWVTSDPFPALLERFGRLVGLPAPGADRLTSQLGRKVLGVFRPGRQPSAYDQFMRRLHHFLKANERFQDRCRKRLWTFGPGAAWLAFTDTVSHAVLRGRFALEHTFFVAPGALVLPELSPPVLLQQACAAAAPRRAA